MPTWDICKGNKNQGILNISVQIDCEIDIDGHVTEKKLDWNTVSSCMQGSLHIPQFSTSTKSVRSYHTGIYYGAIIYGIY